MCSSAAVHILMVFLLFHVIYAELFSFIPQKQPIIGVLGEEVILPCQLTATRIPESTSIQIQWAFSDFSKKFEVKSYHGRDKPETENEQYHGRTELFYSEFKSGNMSLKLKSTSLSDKGTYTCTVTLDKWFDEVVVDLSLAGKGTEPAIALVGYTGHGIDLTCSSQGWYPKPQVSWLDSKGKNRSETYYTQTQLVAGIFSVLASITVEPGVSNEITCRITNDLLQSKSETRILISGVFFPITPPWMAPFIILLVLFIGLGLYVGYKLKVNNQNVSQHEMKKNETKMAYNDLQQVIESEKNTREGGIHELRQHSIRNKKELDIRRAQSYAVAVTLDSDYTHPLIDIGKDKKSVKLKDLSTEKVTSAPEILTVMGKEGYDGGKQYWEVRVGGRRGWQLGVLTESARNQAKKKNFAGPLREGCWALRNSHGKFFSEPGENVVAMKADVDYSVIGLFLDREEGKLLFYSSGMIKFCIISISVQTNEKLYPFLSFVNVSEY